MRNKKPHYNQAIHISSFTQSKEKDVGAEGRDLAERMIAAGLVDKEPTPTKKRYTQQINYKSDKGLSQKELEQQGYQPSVMHQQEQPQVKILNPSELLNQQKKVVKINKQIAGKSFFKKSLRGVLLPRKARPMQERLKIMRLGNMLEKKRLQNEIQKLKLQKQVEKLRQTGKLKQIITSPIFRPKLPLYPAYATPEVMGDIDSAFNADIGTGENMYGGEDYFGGENYYPEDYYGDEFSGFPNNDPFYHLGIKIKNGVSPLFW